MKSGDWLDASGSPEETVKFHFTLLLYHIVALSFKACDWEYSIQCAGSNRPRGSY